MASTIDKVQKLQNGQILFLNAAGDIIKTAPDGLGIRFRGTTQLLIMDGESLLVQLTQGDVTKLQYYPNPEAAAPLTAQALALELATNFFRG